MKCRTWRIGIWVTAVAAAGCTREPTGPNRRTPAVADTLFGADRTEWFEPTSLGVVETTRLLVDAGTIYYSGRLSANGDEELIAREGLSGGLRWHQPARAGTSSVLAGNRIGTANGALSLFDRGSGALTGTFAPAEGLTGNVASDGTQFFVGTYYGRVIAVNGATGNADWATALATGTSTRTMGIAVSGERVAAALVYDRPQGVLIDSGIVALLDRGSGAVLWRRVIAGTERSAAILDAPVLSGGVVVITTIAHSVRAFDLSTGADVWAYDGSRANVLLASFGLATCDGALFVSDGNEGLLSLDAQSGAVNWQLPDLQVGSLEGIECGYGTVLVHSGLVKLFDARTGALLRRVPAIERTQIFVESVARDQDFLYVTTDRGTGATRLP